MSAPASWFSPDPRTGRRDPKARLFLLPYAGGGAGIYRAWPALLPAALEVRAVQLPGRERRFAEPPVAGMEALLDALVPAIEPLLDRPYALFGHSMGAAIAHALTLRLTAAGHPPPAFLAPSGRDAPHAARPDRPSLHTLPEEAFLAALRRLGGTPPEVLADRELLALVLPVLRADFALVAGYRPGPRPMVLPCPIVAYGGAEDAETTPTGLAAWADCAPAGLSRLTIFPGGHFFMSERRDALIADLTRELYRRLPLGNARPSPG